MNTESPTGKSSDFNCKNVWKVERVDDFNPLHRTDDGEREKFDMKRSTVRPKTHSNAIPVAVKTVPKEKNKTIERDEGVRRYVGGMPLLTNFCLAMRTDSLPLIGGVSEFVMVIYDRAETFAFPDAKLEAYRSSVLHLNLVSVEDRSALNWCEQNMLRE